MPPLRTHPLLLGWVALLAHGIRASPVGAMDAAAFEGLGDLPGGPVASVALAVSGDGSTAVGTSASSSAPEEAFLWRDGVMAGLGDLPGGIARSSAFAVSADGGVVVGLAASWLGPEAFRWQAGLLQGLGDLPGGFFGSGAFAASADGSVVVGSSESSRGLEAVVWTERDGMRSLHEILENDFAIDLAGWTLEQARGVSDDGRIVVGRGVNPAGDPEGWIATIPASEPARVALETAALPVLAVIGIFASSRRGSAPAGPHGAATVVHC